MGYFVDIVAALVRTCDCSHAIQEQRAFKNVNNYLNTSIYSYFETSGGKSSNLYLNVIHFFNTSVKETSLAA